MQVAALLPNRCKQPFRSSRHLRRYENRDPEEKRAALACFTLNRDVPPMKFHQSLGNGQTKPCALLTRTASLELMKRPKESWKIFRQYSRTLVVHTNFYFTVNPPDDNINVSSGPAVLYCIGNKVDKDLSEPGLVNDKLINICTNIEGKFNLFLFESHLQHPTDSISEVVYRITCHR